MPIAASCDHQTTLKPERGGLRMEMPIGSAPFFGWARVTWAIANQRNLKLGGDPIMALWSEGAVGCVPISKVDRFPFSLGRVFAGFVLRVAAERIRKPVRRVDQRANLHPPWTSLFLYLDVPRRDCTRRWNADEGEPFFFLFSLFPPDRPSTNRPVNNQSARAEAPR